MNDLPRLRHAHLPHLPQHVIKPAYPREKITNGIVHLGVGAFHRAHQAVYMDDVLQRSFKRGESLNWGITGVSLRRADMYDALVPQNCLYSVITRDGQGDAPRIIGSLTQMLVAQQDPPAVIAALANRDVKIISLTITEKGYCYLPATATLDENHPDICHDITHLEYPKSALGFLVAAIKKRRDLNLPPFTLLSCDNLPANGETLKRVMLRFAELAAPELVDYMLEHIAFPSTMVDRIVPATTEADIALTSALLGCRDAWPVTAEPFSQWVVEDNFSSPRPALEEVGVRLVGDVAPFELMKLRLLNGSHSTLAYLGFLAGYETISDVMANPNFARFIRAMMDHEIDPTLPRLPDFDLNGYKDELIARFQNPALKHKTWQIAMDGSQKIPQRLLGTIRAQLEQHGTIAHLALGLAGWMRYATGIDEQGNKIDVRDPQAELIRSRVANKTSAHDLLDGYLSLEGIFGNDLPHHPPFKAALRHALEQLFTYGAKHCVQLMMDAA